MSLVIVCYDTPSPRRRRRIARLLEGYGLRVQKSVFECMLTPRQLATLQAAMQQLIAPQHDRVRYYALCNRDRSRVLICDPHGLQKLPQLWQF